MSDSIVNELNNQVSVTSALQFQSHSKYQLFLSEAQKNYHLFLKNQSLFPHQLKIESPHSSKSLSQFLIQTKGCCAIWTKWWLYISHLEYIWAKSSTNSEWSLFSFCFWKKLQFENKTKKSLVAQILNVSTFVFLLVAQELETHFKTNIFI